jgi:hypothetical protein
VPSHLRCAMANGNSLIDHCCAAVPRAKAQPIAILTLNNRTLRRVAQVFIEELRAVAKEVPAAASTAKDYKYQW